MNEMWEILVPTQTNSGKPIRKRQHKEWDARVMRISTGMTVLMPTKGKWRNLNNILYDERMIPVRISCTREQLMQILNMTKKFYDQEKVLAIKISEEVILF